jgi:hypothetical protein
MGFKQGLSHKHNLVKAQKIAHELELVDYVKPKFLPKPLFFWIAKRSALKTYKGLIERYAPCQAERIVGISHGAEIDVKDIYLDLATETMLAAGCTSIGILPEKSTTGDILMCRNFDIFESMIPLYIGRHNNPLKGLSNIDFSLCFYPSNFHGMNEKGLTITYDYANPTDKVKPGLPISILIQEALENLETTGEVVEFLQDKPKGNGAILLIGDPMGDLRTVEISYNRMAVRQPEEGFIVNTNHYLDEKMIPIDTKDPLWRESSMDRFDRALQLVSESCKVDEKTLQNILSDHGLDGVPSQSTICQHNSKYPTTTSVIFNLNKKTVKVAVGKPCQSQYKKFKIK